MNDDELITVVKESVTDVHMTIPAEQIISRSHAIRTRRRIPSLAGALAVVAAAVLAVTVLLPRPPATVRPSIHLTAWTVVKHADGNDLCHHPPAARSGRAAAQPSAPTVYRPVSSSETRRTSSRSRVSGTTATTLGYCRRSSPQ